MKYKIGDKVVPFQKTSKVYPGLKDSKNWKRAKEKNQFYLFIRKLPKDTMHIYSEPCYLLNDINEGDHGDFFAECDFKPYKPYRRIIKNILNKGDKNEN